MSKKRKKMISVTSDRVESYKIIVNPNKIKVRGGEMPPPQNAHKNKKKYNRKSKHKKYII